MKIIFIGDYNKPEQQIDIDFKTNTELSDLKDVLSHIFDAFKIEKDTEFYCLMKVKDMKFITDKTWKIIKKNDNDDPIQLIDFRIFATECINNLKDCYKIALFEKDASGKNNAQKVELSRLKLLVFRLNDLLNHGMFSEEFIAFRGMEVLTSIIKDFNAFRNIQSYSLNCLCKSMMYLNGLEYIKQNKSIIHILFSFIRIKENVSVVRGALYMIQIICQYSDSSVFQIIHQSALNNMRDSNIDYNGIHIDNILRQIKCGKYDHYDPSKLPYFEVVDCMNNSNDLDIIKNAFKLIITLIKKATNEQEKKLFCDTLIAVGIIEKLIALKKASIFAQDNDMNILLVQFQALTENIFPASELNVWILQARIKKLHERIHEKEEQIQDMNERYAMIDILEDEFIRYHTALNDAYHDGLLINAGLYLYL